jgi:chromosome segregation ATPase
VTTSGNRRRTSTTEPRAEPAVNRQRNSRITRLEAERDRAVEAARKATLFAEECRQERDRLTAALVDTNEHYVNAEMKNLELQGRIDRIRDELRPLANVNQHIKRLQKEKCSACGKAWPCVSESIRIVLEKSENP